MKRFLFVPVAMLIVFCSCDKNEKFVSEKEIPDSSEIVSAASALSGAHDSIVHEMLEKTRALTAQRISVSGTPDDYSDLLDAFDIISEVTGVKPVLLENGISEKQQVLSGTMNDTPALILDIDDNPGLSEYAGSELSARYLSLVDAIIEDSLLGAQEKWNRISQIQERVLNDQKATVTDIESLLYGTELLKGSLLLWNNEYGNFSIKSSADPTRLSATSITKWGFFKKLAFVAAADAVGGVLGLWLGGYITVNGVSMYIPAGPGGAAAAAASVSFIAAKLVGW